jgi:hypothetical protein
LHVGDKFKIKKQKPGASDSISFDSAGTARRAARPALPHS